MSPLFGGASGENTLLIDVSSGSTGGAIIHRKPGGLSELVALTRTPLQILGDPSFETLERSVAASLEITLATLVAKTRLLKERGYGTTFDKGIVTLSSPWIDSYIRMVNISDNKGFHFDTTRLNQILEREKEQFRKELKSSSTSETEIFESAVMDLYLNGYASRAPIRDKINEAEICLVLSASTKTLLSNIEDKLIKSLGLKRGVAMHSFIFIFYRVLSHSFQNLSSALLINMTEETTDILFLRHGSQVVSAMLPFGPSRIAKAVADKLSLEEALAHSYLALFANGDLDEKLTETLSKILELEEANWQVLWKKVGEGIVNATSVPYSIFLVVPSGFGRLIKIFLESAFPQRNIILIGDTNTFTRELVKNVGENVNDENLLMTASFSNFIN